jgi:hypothetical protein
MTQGAGTEAQRFKNRPRSRPSAAFHALLCTLLQHGRSEEIRLFIASQLPESADFGLKLWRCAPELVKFGRAECELKA